MVEEEGGIEEKLKNSGEYVEKALEHLSELHARFNGPYYEWLKDTKGHVAKDYKHIEDLANKIADSLVKHLKEIGVIIDEKKGSKYAEEAQLGAYFGITRGELIAEFKGYKGRITKEVMDSLIKRATEQLSNVLYKAALGGLDDDHVEPGKRYLMGKIKEFDLKERDMGIKFAKIKTHKDLQYAMQNLHTSIKGVKIEKDVEKRYEGYKKEAAG